MTLYGPQADAEANAASAVTNLGRALSAATTKLESATGIMREALASPYIDVPALAERKRRALQLLMEAGALVVLEQTKAR